MNFEVDKIVKIKKPSFPFQKTLRYRIVLVKEGNLVDVELLGDADNTPLPYADVNTNLLEVVD